MARKNYSASRVLPILLAALLTGSCASSVEASNTVTPSSDLNSPSGESSQIATAVVPIPEGFQRPAALAGDAAGRGVFFFSESRTDARIFHWDGSSLESWSVGNPSTNPELQTAIENAIAAGPSGQVWVGINDVLLDLDTNTGRVTSVNLPPAMDSASAESYRPAQVQGTHSISISGLAVDPSSGDVAVIRDAATDVELRSTTGAFRQIQLAADMLPNNVAFAASGTLAVATSSAPNGQAQTGAVTLIDPATGEVVASRRLPSNVTVAGTSNGMIVTSVFHGGPPALEIDATGTSQSVTAATPQVSITPDVAVVSVSGSRILEGTTTGFTLFNVVTGFEQDATFPTWDCSGPAVPPGVTLAPSSNTSCARRALALTLDAAGNIWALASGPQTVLGEFAAGQY